MTSKAIKIAGRKTDWAVMLRAVERLFSNGEICRPEYVQTRDLLRRCAEICDAPGNK